MLKQALQKVSFIPFAYIVDKWRWSVFSGNTKPDEYNAYWWDLRKQYQGIEPPRLKNGDKDKRRMEDTDLFDAGTFFHVAHNTEYLRYFLSHVLQFQFHEALCDESGHTGPYHKCSIHKSKAAGKKLRYVSTWILLWDEYQESMTRDCLWCVHFLVYFYSNSNLCTSFPVSCVIILVYHTTTPYHCIYSLLKTITSKSCRYIAPAMPNLLSLWRNTITRICEI